MSVFLNKLGTFLYFKSVNLFPNCMLIDLFVKA